MRVRGWAASYRQFAAEINCDRQGCKIPRAWRGPGRRKADGLLQRFFLQRLYFFRRRHGLLAHRFLLVGIL